MKKILTIFIVVTISILGIGKVSANEDVFDYGGVIYYRSINSDGSFSLKSIDTLPNNLTANDLTHYEYITYSYSSGNYVKLAMVQKLDLKNRMAAQDKEYALYTLYNNSNPSGPYLEWWSSIMIYEYDVQNKTWKKIGSPSYTNTLNIARSNNMSDKNNMAHRLITTVKIIDQVPTDSYITDYDEMYNYPRVLMKGKAYLGENGQATSYNVKFLTPYRKDTYVYGVQLNGGTWLEFPDGVFQLSPWGSNGFLTPYNTTIRFRVTENGELIDIVEGKITFLQNAPVNIKGSIKFEYDDEFTTLNFWWDDLSIDYAYQYSLDNQTWIDIDFHEIDKEKGFSILTDLPKGTKVYSRVLGFDDEVLLTLEGEIGSKEVTGENIQDNINDTNVDGSTEIGSGFFGDFEDNDFGLSSVIIAPLEMIKSITTKSCTPIEFNLPYVNEKLTMPCMTEIYEESFPDILYVWQLVTEGLVAYYVAIKIYALVKDFKDPDNDKIEVVDL